MEMPLSVYGVFRWLTSNPVIACASPREFFVGWGSFSDVISN